MPEHSEAEQYDVLVFGSGEAGKSIAWSLGSAGKRTAVVECCYIGGSCPNIACLPSKNFIHSAKVIHYAGMAKEFGLHAGAPGVDMQVVRARSATWLTGLLRCTKRATSRVGLSWSLALGGLLGLRRSKLN